MYAALSVAEGEYISMLPNLAAQSVYAIAFSLSCVVFAHCEYASVGGPSNIGEEGEGGGRGEEGVCGGEEGGGVDVVERCGDDRDRGKKPKSESFSLPSFWYSLFLVGSLTSFPSFDLSSLSNKITLTEYPSNP